MKVLYICLSLLPLVASDKSPRKLQLLARLLETLNRNEYGRHYARDVGSTTPDTFSQTTAPVLVTSSSGQGDTGNTQNSFVSTSDSSTEQDSTSIVTFDTDTTPGIDVSTSNDDVSTPNNDISTPGDIVSTTDDIASQEANSGQQPNLPPVDKTSKPLSPEHYIRHVTEGMCVMLSYVRGIEKAKEQLGTASPRQSSSGPIRGNDSPRSRKDGGRQDRDNDEEGDEFPWKKADILLQQLCNLVDNYNAEPMKLAEAFVEKMAEHKGAKRLKID